MTLITVEIMKAKKKLEGAVYHTPLTYSKELSDINGVEIYLKWENMQKTG